MAKEQRFLTNYANGTLCLSGARCTNSQIRQTGLGYARQQGQHPRVTTDTPKNADYAALTARMTSFCDWDIRTISSNELAEAGFYYTGINDYVRCFMCGCGVKDWERGDKAWIEHARWSPNCAFLNQQKSEEFVRLCQSSNINDREKTECLLLNQGPQHQVHDEDQQTSFMQHSSAESLPFVENESAVMSKTSSETSEPILGIEDFDVRCVFGGSGVKDWERGVKDWIDDAIWSPNCAFLDHQTSEEFVRLCQSSNINEREMAERLLNQVPQHQGHDEDQQTSFVQHCSAESPPFVENESSVMSETSSETSEPILGDNFWCSACRIRSRNIIFVACGHLLFCERCQLHFKYCPACGTKIKPWMKVLWN